MNNKTVEELNVGFRRVRKTNITRTRVRHVQ